MDKAMQCAIEGGWKTGFSTEYKIQQVTKKAVWFVCNGKHDEGIWLSEILLDPLFWKSLGKQQGWDIEGDHINCRKDIGCSEHCKKNWKTHWHSLIDHIADGGDVDSFFNKLLV